MVADKRVFLHRLYYGLPGTFGNDFPGGVAEANNFVPVVARGRGGDDERTEGNCDATGARQARLIAQNLARAAHGHGANRPLHIHGSLESAELKGPDAGHRGESSFGVDGHRLAAAERFFHVFGLAHSSMRIAAVEGEVARAAK